MSEITMPTKKRTHAFLKGWSIQVDKLPAYKEFNEGFREDVNLDLANSILDNKREEWTIIHKLTNEPYSPVMTGLENKIKAFTHGGKKIKYYRANNLGRYYAVDDKSCITLPKKIKHTLFMEAGMVDLDQEKGHPRLAAGLGRMNGHTFDAIEEYIKNPTKIFNEMAEWYGVDISNKENSTKNKNRLKWYFNLTIYGGGYELWTDGLMNPTESDRACGYEPLALKTTNIMPIMQEFKDDCNLLASLIFKQNTGVRDRLELSDDYKDKSDNEKRNAVVSYVLQILENDALYHAYKYLKKEKLITFNGGELCSLEYDGLCFKPKRDITKLDIILMNQYVCEKTGFPIVYALKGYFNGLEGDKSDLQGCVYEDLINKKQEEKEALLEKYDGLDVDMDDPDELKYYDMKAEWEKSFCKVENEDMYFRVDGNSPPVAKDDRQMRKAYQNICYGYYESKNKYGDFVIDYSRPKSFIDRWVKDENNRQIKGYGIYPPPLEVPDGYLNLWSPFPYQNLIQPYKYNNEAVESIKGLIRILVNNDEKSYDYLMNWLSHLLKYPSQKCGKMPIFISEEGCGKGTLMQIIKLLVGEDKYLETSQPENIVWGKFNSLMGSAYFVNLNEIGKKNQQDAEGRIKNMLTDSAMAIKAEGDKPYKITSYHRFMMSSNNEDPTNSKKGDRRKWMVRSSDELIGNKEYWTEMYALIEKKDVIRSFYDHLMAIDSADFMRLETPITEYQEIIQGSNVDTIELFVEWVAKTYHYKGNVNSESGDDDDNSDYGYGVKSEYTSQELYQLFKDFKSKYHIHNYEVSVQKLTKSLQLWSYNNKLIVKNKGRAGNTTSFKYDALVKHFKIGEGEITGCMIKLEGN